MAQSEPKSEPGVIRQTIAQALANDRAVSPVIGVVLLIALTVALTGVVSTLIFGVGGDVTQMKPSADVLFTETDSGTVSVTHKGGETLESGTVKVVYTNQTGSTVRETWQTPVRAGGSPSSGPFAVKAGTTIKVVWIGPEGDESYLLDSYTTAA